MPTIVLGVDVRTRFDEELHQFHSVVFNNRIEEHRIPTIVLGVDVRA